jgi:hypothetical protein
VRCQVRGVARQESLGASTVTAALAKRARRRKGRGFFNCSRSSAGRAMMLPRNDAWCQFGSASNPRSLLLPFVMRSADSSRAETAGTSFRCR